MSVSTVSLYRTEEETDIFFALFRANNTFLARSSTLTVTNGNISSTGRDGTQVAHHVEQPTTRITVNGTYIGRVLCVYRLQWSWGLKMCPY